MKIYRASFVLVLCALPLLAVGCKDKKNTYVAPPPPEVTVANPVRQNIVPALITTGQTAALNEVPISARVNGYIAKINFRDGQTVKAGEALYIIDQRPFKAALDSAKAELEGRKAAVAIADAQFKKIEKAFKSQVASEFEFLEKKGNLESAQAAVAIAESAVESAQINFDFTTVTSPVDGRTRKSAVEVGTLVSNGTLLTTVVNDSKVYAYFSISESELLGLRAGASKRANDPESKIPVELATSADTGFPYTGIIDYADNRIDSGTGTIQVRGIFDNPDEKLYAGLFVRIRIPGKPIERVLIPDTAVGFDQAGSFVFTVDKDNTVSRRGVKVDTAIDRLRPVLDDSLTPADTIIVNGILRTRAGGKVTPLRAPAAPSAPTAPATSSK